MNKRFLRILTVIFICAFATMPSIWARVYEVFKVDGDIRQLIKGKTEAVTVGTKISDLSVFRIGKNAKIGIKDISTKSIYYSTKSGDFSVISIIRDARKNSAGCSAAARKILKSESLRVNSRVLGVVNRGFGDLASSTSPELEEPQDSGYPVSNSYGWVLFRIANGVDSVSQKCPYDIGLTTSVSPLDSVISYKVDFHASEEMKNSVLLYINVLRKESNGDVDFMFAPDDRNGCLVIEPGMSLLIDWFPSVASSDSKYYLVACSRNFSPEKFMKASRRLASNEDSSRPKMFSLKDWECPTWIIPANME